MLLASLVAIAFFSSQCYIYVEWGPEFWDKETDICNENVLSTNWYIRDIVQGEKVDPDLNSATKLTAADYVEEQWSSGGARKLDTDCSGQGTTWGPGIGPPPDGCDNGGGGTGDGSDSGDTGNGSGNGGNGGNGNGDAPSDALEGASPPPTCFKSKCLSFTKNQVKSERRTRRKERKAGWARGAKRRSAANIATSRFVALSVRRLLGSSLRSSSL